MFMFINTKVSVALILIFLEIVHCYTTRCYNKWLCRILLLNKNIYLKIYHLKLHFLLQKVFCVFF